MDILQSCFRQTEISRTRRAARWSAPSGAPIISHFAAESLTVASSLLALLDDIATVLDDVAVMTKVATKKTAGVLGDDLALSAQRVAGLDPGRELPVVWAVAKGSMLNKAILVPAALLLSAFVPWAVIPLMMIGGVFLCFEGVEKLAHKLLHSKVEDDAYHAKIVEVLADPSVDLVVFERDKIKGAIRTDFILSAEIIVISLGTVAKEAFAVQVGVLVAIAIVMTVGVYGLVAGIVKLDDAGLFLSPAERRERPRARQARARTRHPARRALADEVPLHRRHSRDVPSWRRDPHPQRAGAAPRDRGDLHAGRARHRGRDAGRPGGRRDRRRRRALRRQADRQAAAQADRGGSVEITPELNCDERGAGHIHVRDGAGH